MTDFTKFLNARPNNGAGSKNWLMDLGLDVAKLGLFLYLIGLIASSLYYSRFSISALDLAKSQSILLGIYVLGLYVGLPGATLFCLRKVNGVAAVSMALFAYFVGR